MKKKSFFEKLILVIIGVCFFGLTVGLCLRPNNLDKDKSTVSSIEESIPVPKPTTYETFTQAQAESDIEQKRESLPKEKNSIIEEDYYKGDGLDHSMDAAETFHTDYNSIDEDLSPKLYQNLYVYKNNISGEVLFAMPIIYDDYFIIEFYQLDCNGNEIKDYSRHIKFHFSTGDRLWCSEDVLVTIDFFDGGFEIIDNYVPDDTDEPYRNYSGLYRLAYDDSNCDIDNDYTNFIFD